MMNKARNSTAESDFVKDMRQKYNWPSKVPFLLVPTVSSSIYRMSRFNKDLDHGLQRNQCILCSGIYATSMLADKWVEKNQTVKIKSSINCLLYLKMQLFCYHMLQFWCHYLEKNTWNISFKEIIKICVKFCRSYRQLVWFRAFSSLKEHFKSF